MSSHYSEGSKDSNLTEIQNNFAKYTAQNCTKPKSSISSPRSLQESAIIQAEEQSMTGSITRDELDSKLSAVEARMDLRVEKFSSNMKEVIAELRIERAERDTEVNTAIAEVIGRLEPLKDLKVHMWAGVIAVAAVIFTAVALSTSSFDSGRNMTKDLQDVRQELLQKQINTDESLKEISESLKTLAAALEKNNTDAK